MRQSKLFWAFLFALVPIGCVVATAMSPGMGWWLPSDYSIFGADIDWLFNMILVITSVAFVGVQVALCYFLWKYGATTAQRKGTFVHGHHQLEVIWTVIPAAILVFIAVVQWGTWLRIKRPANFPPQVREQLEKDEPFAEVLAGQFEWRITYPGKDGKIGTRDDVHVLNNFHIPKGVPILIRLRSRDVLHSFYLPNFRLKQDAVPGMVIPVWFQAKDNTPTVEKNGNDGEGKNGVFNLMCAELCGWGHYKMKGALTVHETMDDFNKWLEQAKKAEEATE